MQAQQEHQHLQDRVAWIGLGFLGFELTQHLQNYLSSNALPNLVVYNRTRSKSQALQALLPSILIADSIEEVFSKHQANVIFTSLANDAAVQQVYTTLTAVASTLPYQVTFVETGTLYPELSLQLQHQLLTLPKRHIFLQCPVFGRPETAKLAQMVWTTSGDALAVQHLTPLFQSMSRRVIDLNTKDVSLASTFKLLGNFLLMATTESMAESVNLAQTSGLDPQHLVTFVDEFLPAPALQSYARRIVGGAEDQEAVEMTVNVVRKDMETLRTWSEKKHVPMPTADQLEKNYTAAKELGYTKNWRFMIDTLNKQ
ncbi:hypothetical protein EDD11_006388 [Mortierella claussenii]|nr:hypothetical protein EDD11_006388 [Mortierella claussenii]